MPITGKPWSMATAVEAKGAPEVEDTDILQPGGGADALPEGLQVLRWAPGFVPRMTHGFFVTRSIFFSASKVDCPRWTTLAPVLDRRRSGAISTYSYLSVIIALRRQSIRISAARRRWRTEARCPVCQSESNFAPGVECGARGWAASPTASISAGKGQSMYPTKPILLAKTKGIGDALGDWNVARHAVIRLNAQFHAENLRLQPHSLRQFCQPRISAAYATPRLKRTKRAVSARLSARRGTGADANSPRVHSLSVVFLRTIRTSTGCMRIILARRIRGVRLRKVVGFDSVSGQQATAQQKPIASPQIARSPGARLSATAG